MAVHLFLVLGVGFTEDWKKRMLQYLYYWLSVAFGFLAFGAYLGREPEKTGLFIWISNVTDFAHPVFAIVVLLWICCHQFSGYFVLRGCKNKNRWFGEIIMKSFVPAYSLTIVQDPVCQEDYLRFIYFVSCAATGLFSYLTIAMPDDVTVMELWVSVFPAFLSYHQKILYSIYFVVYVAILCFNVIEKIENEKLGNVQNPIRIAAQDDGPRNRGQQHGSPSGGGDGVSTCHDIPVGQDPFSSDEDLLTIEKDDI